MSLSLHRLCCWQQGCSVWRIWRSSWHTNWTLSATLSATKISTVPTHQAWRGFRTKSSIQVSYIQKTSRLADSDYVAWDLKSYRNGRKTTFERLKVVLQRNDGRSDGREEEIQGESTPSKTLTQLQPARFWLYSVHWVYTTRTIRYIWQRFAL